MQAIIKQQEQQLTNSKKDRDQLCFIVDERSNEIRNLKQKNEQLEQMIRNGKIYRHFYIHTFTSSFNQDIDKHLKENNNESLLSLSLFP
jgi:hypothetical protein